MNDHRELLELAPSYPLGPLDPNDCDRIEAHLESGCEECEAVIREASAVADELVHGVTTVEPSAARGPGWLDLVEEVSPNLVEEVSPNLVEEVSLDLVEENGESRVAPPPRETRRPRWRTTALAATVGFSLLLGIRVFQVSRSLETARAERVQVEGKLDAMVSAREQAIALLKAEGGRRERLDRELTDLRTLMSRLTAEQTRSVTLSGVGPLPTASARAYLDPQSRRLVLFVYDLPPVPVGKSYQLWVTAGDQPASAGVFEVDRTGRTRHDALSGPSLAGDVTVAVTIEPEGGSPQPRGPTVLAGATGGAMAGREDSSLVDSGPRNAP